MAAAGRKGCGGGRDEEEGGGGGGGGPGASSPSPSPSSSSSSSSSSLWRPCRARLPFLSFLFLFLFFLLLAVVPASSSGSRRGGRAVKALSDGEWRELLAGEWMVAFYAPWCPACQNLQPEWESFAEWEEDLEINIAKVDVTEQPGLSGRFIITALPTIYHAVVMSAALQGALSAPALEAFKAKLDNPPDSCKDGEFRRYQGPRTKNDFISFISDQEWRSIEPVSSWFVPSSFLMSSMSALFQLSMWIRHCHNYFTESLGIPPWGSYAIFALATLFSGLLLGLVMVFLADCICPSKKRRPMQRPSQKNRPEAAEPVRKRGGADGGDLSDADLGPSEPVCADPTSNAVRQRVVAPGAEVAAAS